MKTLLIIIGFSLSTIFGTLFFKNKDKAVITKEKIVYKNPTDTIYDKIIFQQVREGGLIFIPVEINGRKVWMLMDTGAGSTIVDIGRSGRLGMLLEENSYIINGIGGQVESYNILNTSRIKVGNKEYSVNFQAIDLTLLTNRFSSAIGQNVIGILGSDFFEKHGFVIDYVNNTTYSIK